MGSRGYLSVIREATEQGFSVLHRKGDVMDTATEAQAYSGLKPRLGSQLSNRFNQQRLSLTVS
jgi:hypothetical protein